MPELPEVETVVRTLNELVNGRRIAEVDVRLARIIQKPDDPALFAALLAGRTIERVERRGKFIRFLLDGLVLVSHLRMEGRYGLFERDEEPDAYTHVVFRFEDGKDLRYRDVRQFGTMHIFEPGEEWRQAPLNKLGVEPLDAKVFTAPAFRKLLGKRTTKIKPFLLDQTYVAGLGNIYVDEALHAAGIHPERPAGSLKKREAEALHAAIVRTLQDAVNAGGSSVKSYVNGQGEIGLFQYSLRAYGRKNEPCLTCGKPIRRIVVGGRGTHYCESCQR